MKNILSILALTFFVSCNSQTKKTTETKKNETKKEMSNTIVKTDEESFVRIQKAWNEKFPDLTLHVLESPYRSISEPILDFIKTASREHPTEFITVIFPEFVTAKWHHQLLHNQTAWLIKLSLMYKKNVVVTSVKYHLETT